MQFVAQYPIAAEHVTPHVGRPIAAMTIDGDVAYGVIDRIHDGHLVMRPLENVPGAVIASLKKELQKKMTSPSKHPKMKKIRTQAWAGAGFGRYPYGWGYGNYGWGAGLWWLLPLTFLAAFAFFPFVW